MDSLEAILHKIINDKDFRFDIFNLKADYDVYVKFPAECEKYNIFNNSFFLSMVEHLYNLDKDQSTTQLIVLFFKFIVEKVRFTPRLNLIQSKRIEKFGNPTNSLLHSTIASSVNKIMKSAHWNSDLQNTPDLFYSLAFLLPYLHECIKGIYIIIDNFVNLHNKFDENYLDKVSNALYLLYNSGSQNQEDVFTLTLRVMIAANGLPMYKLRSYFIEMYSDNSQYYDILIYDEIKDKIQNSIEEELPKIQFQSRQEIISIIDSLIKNSFPDLKLGDEEKKKISQKVDDLCSSNQKVREVELKLKILKALAWKDISKNLYSLVDV
ncbi:hypothetical protein TVAG_089260 [Trichomonas vaginalis G3]|uniref:Uncharacterized protein n=1 Tax=Trichomonas vaginalis (strain ATCC PRA-98 / G3) TaxID=412133 RepID=A2G4J4_TRIV3|nr:hypothetical protein TVAGG3_0819420 [Trichomonas vaginalis G3]EAX87918.1 hypothetical protein TVAG_089260 [Trichomonas vaginalis G3]KAI5497766.1 hypothetical protein TVAGG3_0819420 [Trichomonas vaginalis G3]|eukprot:XP_001300848.1 hypothetical protein [Trichomonas vaginalis G3]